MSSSADVNNILIGKVLIINKSDCIYAVYLFRTFLLTQKFCYFAYFFMKNIGRVP